MIKRKKRARGSNWNHAHTRALAELKREASFNKEDGRLAWERIAQTLSSRFPGQIRTGDQCRRRWDTLVKVYNHIEDYCVVTGAQNHRELDRGELASMKLDTAYQQDWYNIVEQVCSQRKRKERCDRDLMLEKRSKGSLSVELPEHPPRRDTLGSASTSKSVTHHEQSTPKSTTTYAQVPSSSSLEANKLGPEEEVPRLENGNDGLMLEQSTTAHAQVSSSASLEVDKLSPEEEVPRLKNGNDGLGLEAMQLRQHGQVSHEVSQEPETLKSANVLPHTFPAEIGAQLKEPLQDDLWDWVDAMPIETSVEIEQYGTEPELTDPSFWDWESVFCKDLKDKPRPYSSIEPANVARGTKMWGAPIAKATSLGKMSSASFASNASNASNASWESNFTRLNRASKPESASSATMTSSTKSSRNADSTISRQVENGAQIEQSETESELTKPFDWDLESVGLRARKKKLLQDHVRDDSFGTAIASKASGSKSSGFKILSPPALHSERGRRLSLEWDVPEWCKRPFVSVNHDELIPSATMISSTSSRSADSTISRQSRRWSLKVIVLKIRQCCHACKERTEDMEMESKQAARLKEIARKKALMSRKENVPAMSIAASATRGNKPLQKDTERISKQAASDKKEEETMPHKAERQQLGGKSSSKCLPVGKLCIKLSRKLFPVFHDQSSN